MMPGARPPLRAAAAAPASPPSTPDAAVKAQQGVQVLPFMKPADPAAAASTAGGGGGGGVASGVVAGGSGEELTHETAGTLGLFACWVGA
jgi:hypothetical protein